MVGAASASGARAAAGAVIGARTGPSASPGAGAGAFTLAEETRSLGPVTPLSEMTPNWQVVPLLTYTLQEWQHG